MSDHIYRISQLASRKRKDGTILRHGITGLGESAIYLRVAAGTFPKPIDLGGRARGWRSSDIDRWIEERRANSRDIAQGTRRPSRRAVASRELAAAGV